MLPATSCLLLYYTQSTPILEMFYRCEAFMPGSASTSGPTQSLQKVTGFPNFSSRILATGAKEYLESSLVTLVKATNQWFVKWTNKICKNSKGRSTMIHSHAVCCAIFGWQSNSKKKLLNFNRKTNLHPKGHFSTTDPSGRPKCEAKTTDLAPFSRTFPNFTATEKGRCWS